VALPDSTEEWPHVDVLIPTYNEPLDLVRYTALGALNMDWPRTRYTSTFWTTAGARSLSSSPSKPEPLQDSRRQQHAKAGNINAALESMSSPFVAIFDCDHVPTRSFLQMTMAGCCAIPSWPCCRRRTISIRPTRLNAT